MEELPVLETDRLYLRSMSKGDASDLFSFLSDKEVTKYLDIDSLSSVEQAEDIIELMNKRYNDKKGTRWGIFLQETDRLIGTAGFNSWSHRGEIGYDLARDYWGQGYMTEALNEVISTGFKLMEIQRIEALVLVDGKRSAKLLNRLGFTLEGILRQYAYFKNRYWDVQMFSLLKREWEG